VVHVFQSQEQRRLMKDDHVIECALLAKSQQAKNCKNHSAISESNANNYNKQKGGKKSYPPC